MTTNSDTQYFFDLPFGQRSGRPLPGSGQVDHYLAARLQTLSGQVLRAQIPRPDSSARKYETDYAQTEKPNSDTQHFLDLPFGQ